MGIPDGTIDAAECFGRFVIRRKWAEILHLFALDLQKQHTADSLQLEFGWKLLGPRLRRMHIDLTGESEDIVPHIDPPKRFEAFEVEDRDAPIGVVPSTEIYWVEVDFLPSEDSEFDVCYNCFLAFIDEGGPRIAAFAIESSTE